jgi:RNA polymerase sigma-70 factor (ECF subfamily)
VDSQSQALDRFLAGAERRALRMAELATGNRDDALDIVQEAMLTLARQYGDRGTSEWGPLFQVCLHSRINDWHRRRRVRDRFRVWLSYGRDEGEDQDDPLENIADDSAREPWQRLHGAQALASIDAALRALPLRQQQAFMLRIWEGLDVAQTAQAMACSQGSVKTHLFRAVQSLRAQLQEYAP